MTFSMLDRPEPAEAGDAFVSRRPPVEHRTFTSDAVERTIARVKAKIGDPELAWLFENCYPNTLDTTVHFTESDPTHGGRPDAFVITGDIDAMWLRDSSAQVMPYLPLCNEDPKLAKMIVGLIHRQARCIHLDPYANAFYADGTRESEWRTDKTLMKPGVHERKWELDSLCYPIRLAHAYWAVTADKTPFDADWVAAMRLAVDTMVDQQRKTGHGGYSFIRPPHRNHVSTRPSDDGYGRPIKPTGMICSAFRPSDDAAEYLFNVPENLFAVVSLRQLAGMLDDLQEAPDLAAHCRALADEVERAVWAYGVVDHPPLGKMYAYEVDGLGNVLLMDDANAPGLTTIPFLGYGTIDDPLYRNSRQFAQSTENPFFFAGRAAAGVGSPHTPRPFVWPMGLINAALTSDEDTEITVLLHMLRRSSAGTGFMHEAFHPDDPKKFSRPWFAWANTLFGGLIVRLEHERPALLAGPL